MQGLHGAARRLVNLKVISLSIYRVSPGLSASVMSLCTEFALRQNKVHDIEICITFFDDEGGHEAMQLELASLEQAWDSAKMALEQQLGPSKLVFKVVQEQ